MQAPDTTFGKSCCVSFVANNGSVEACRRLSTNLPPSRSQVLLQLFVRKSLLLLLRPKLLPALYFATIYLVTF